MFKNTALALTLAAGGCSSFDDDPLDSLDDSHRTAVLSARQERITNAKETVEPYIGPKAPLHCLTDKSCEWDETRGQVRNKVAYDTYGQTRMVILDCRSGEARFSQASRSDMSDYSAFILPRRADLNFTVATHETATGELDTDLLKRAAIDDVPLAMALAEAWCPENFGEGAIHYVEPEQRWEMDGLSLTILAALTLATALTTFSSVQSLRQTQIRAQFSGSRLITALGHDTLTFASFTAFVASVGVVAPSILSLADLYAVGSSYLSLANMALAHLLVITGSLAYFMKRVPNSFLEGTLASFVPGAGKTELSHLKIVAERLEASDKAGLYPKTETSLKWMLEIKQKFLKMLLAGSLSGDALQAAQTIHKALDNMIHRAQAKIWEKKRA